MNKENMNNIDKSSSIVRQQQYRFLLNRMEEIQETEDVGIGTVNELGLVLKEVTAIDRQCPFANRVEYIDETLLEHKVLSTASSMLVKCIENADISLSTYESTDFASKLLDSINQSNDHKSWLDVLQTARKIIPSLDNFSSLYGTFDPMKVPEQKERKERCKQDVQEKVQLKQVHDLQKEEEGVEDSVNFLGHILAVEYEKNNNRPIVYLDFVVDSTSFEATIENMFYTSFLIREGKAKMEVEDNIATIEPMRKRDLIKFRENGGENTQMIAALSMEDWEVLRIEKGYIQTHKDLLKSKS